MSENNAVLTFQAEESKTENGSSVAQNMSRFKAAVFSLRITNIAGDTPTITPKLVHSMDNVHFVDLHSFGSKDAVGHWTLAVPNDTEFGFMPFVKWEWTLGGDDPNVTIECTAIGKE